MIVLTRDLTKIYTKKNQSIHAVRQCNLQIEQGDFAVIYGRSGSGKSTLLLMLGGMLHPSSGKVFYQEEDIYSNPSFLRNQYRKRIVGFMFQKFYLMPYLTIADNIRLSLNIQKIDQEEERMQSLMSRLGLEDRTTHLPEELSVGEQQRAALARTLAGDPELILADEPTGNLDAENMQIILQCLCKENKQGKTIVLVTHEESFMEIGTKRCHLESGQIIDQL